MWRHGGKISFLVCVIVFEIISMTTGIYVYCWRIHSSRMRTVRCSGHLGKGGVSAWGDVCLRGGGVCLSGE